MSSRARLEPEVYAASMGEDSSSLYDARGLQPGVRPEAPMARPHHGPVHQEDARMSELTIQLKAALIELRVNRMLPDDYDGATENAIGHIERALELAEARSSHSDVSADLRAEVEKRLANEVALGDTGQYSMGRQSAYRIVLDILGQTPMDWLATLPIQLHPDEAALRAERDRLQHIVDLAEAVTNAWNAYDSGDMDALRAALEPSQSEPGAQEPG